MTAAKTRRYGIMIWNGRRGFKEQGHVVANTRPEALRKARSTMSSYKGNWFLAPGIAE